MRVLLVSAHYPPNFVSGGSLQPAHLARGLADRGHDVQVYAGWVGADRDPLSTHESTEDGVGVRWVVTTHALHAGDDRNWDNPEVTADFAGVLRSLDPDVVHIHGLQGLGVGVAREAIRHRARVVVTMHDFWWFCARGFLVDRAWRPCSLVVDCGDCQCERGRAWLDERTAALAEVLDQVDVVLAPSQGALDIAVANGVDPDRAAVDENGLQPIVRSPIVRSPGGRGPDGSAGTPITFLYVGGPNPMKGATVVVDAAARLAERLAVAPAARPWRIVAYGLDAVADPPVPGLEPRTAFTPDRIDQVYAEADVVLVPSLMRESHSLVTREALGRGIPVVCSDSVGPEEVVRDGRNGRVVAARDADTLAAGLADVLADLARHPELLDRLAAGAREPIRLVALDEQLDHLEAVYTAPPPASAPPPEPARAVRHVCFLVGIDGAPLRYRVHLPAEALAEVGITSEVHWYRDPEVATAALGADAVVLYRVPATVEVLELVARVREHGRPVLYDVDDLIFDPSLHAEIPALAILPPDEAALWLDGVHRYRTTLEACDAFVGSTDRLVAQAAAVVPGLRTYRFDNGVGRVGARAADEARRRPRAGGPLRIGYFSGTTTHDRDWAMVAPAVADVLRARPDVELWLGGWVPEVDLLGPFASRTRRLGFVSWTRLPGVLRDVDVNLAPLETDHAFNDAKSAIKWLEAGLAGTPTVCSPTAPFLDAVDDGRSGVVAADADAWVAGIAGLLDDGARRAAMGEQAGRAALLRWSPRRQGDRYRAVLEAAARDDVGRAAARATDWVAVAPSEPLFARPHPREPYAEETPLGRRWQRWREATGGRAAWARVRAGALGHRTRELWATEGVAGVGRGVVRRLGPGRDRD